MTTTKQAAPATPLPWKVSKPQHGRFPAYSIDNGSVKSIAMVSIMARGGTDQDAAYIVAACNAYPRLLAERAELVAALRLGRSAEDHLARQALLRKMENEK